MSKRTRCASLVHDRRIVAVLNDIVVEFGDARYQDVMDRFVRGDQVSFLVLRRSTLSEPATLRLSVGREPLPNDFGKSKRAFEHGCWTRATADLNSTRSHGSRTRYCPFKRRCLLSGMLLTPVPEASANHVFSEMIGRSAFRTCANRRTARSPAITDAGG